MKASELIIFREGRQYINKIAGARFRTIKLINGDSSPKKVGQSYHYETKGGRMIDHPNAYKKNGWSNMVYISSSRKVEVGKDWKSDFKFKFPIENRYAYLSYILKNIGFDSLSFNNENNKRQYLIQNYSNFNSGHISISEYRNLAKKLLKLTVFL
jgi:hypothetical protein